MIKTTLITSKAIKQAFYINEHKQEKDEYFSDYIFSLY